ncbi:MAG: hypothetical protein PUD30_07780, partial [Muribaculaceae bacterium]|nr:hypothetical protein [Muribaculaceae bacterium]
QLLDRDHATPTPQEAITTEATNALGEKIRFRQCTNPSQPTLDIYQRLNYRPMPFKKNQAKEKFVAHKPLPLSAQLADTQSKPPPLSQRWVNKILVFSE